MIRVTSVDERSLNSLPRTRGDDPLPSGCNGVPSTFAPHARG